jgi:hypothetical protein
MTKYFKNLIPLPPWEDADPGRKKGCGSGLGFLAVWAAGFGNTQLLT